MPQGWTDDAMAEVFGALALRAAVPVMEVYDGPPDARQKPDGSPVTEADLRAETVILQGLRQHWPQIPAVSEEQPALTPFEPCDEFFLVDPLDGTREFLARNGEFTINIAMVRGGAPVCGALYAPAFERLWIAGTETYEIAARPGGELPARASWRRLQARAWPAAPVALVSRSHLTAETLRQLGALQVGAHRQVGSSLKFALIASGEADVTVRVGPTMEWDTAAGDAVLRAAGGCVTTLEGIPLRYGDAVGGFRNPDFIARCGGAGVYPKSPHDSLRFE